MKPAIAFALNTGTQLAKVGCDAIRLKARVTNVAEDGLTAAKRAIRKSQYAAQDFVDEVIFAVKKQPLKAVGIASGIAFGGGLLAGWIARASRK